jgi:uncharacterized protein (UPF0262 family)
MSERVTSLTLDEGTIRKRAPEVEHEKSTAILDLLQNNSFAPHCLNAGPYALNVSVRDGRLVFDIQSEATEDKKAQLALSLAPLRSLIRDYFIVCESYHKILGSHGSTRVEAIDMGRRGLHNEGAEILMDMLKGRITVDFPTARRLFTLICVLHIR